MWYDGDGVDVVVDTDGADGSHGDIDREGDGDVDSIRVMNGTLSLPVGTGITDSVSVPSRSESSTKFAGFKEIDPRAVVVSWVKLAGPLVLVVVCFSCLVDHWRRC